MKDIIHISRLITELTKRRNTRSGNDLMHGQKFAPILSNGMPSIGTVYQAELIDLPDGSTVVIGKKVGSSANKAAPDTINAETFLGGRVALIKE